MIPSNSFLKCSLLLALFAVGAVQAQTFYTPAYRGQAGSESAFWNYSFTNNTGGANQAATVAPGGSTLANASVVSTAANTILTGGGIYGYPTINSFVLNYSVLDVGSFPNGVGNVVFQAETGGNPLDYNSVVLTYTTLSGTQTLSATRDEIYNSGPGGMGADIVSAWSWNLPMSDDVTSFSILFNGSAQHNYLESVVFDVSPFNVAPVPEPGTLALAGMGGVGVLLFGQRVRRQVSR